MGGKDKMDEKWKTYLAALIDGEGSICVESDKRRVTCRPRVTIANNCEELLRFAQKLINGSYVYHIFSTEKGNLYQLNLCRSKCVMELLEEILPYLIVKRRKAEEALIFLQNSPNKKRWKQ